MTKKNTVIYNITTEEEINTHCDYILRKFGSNTKEVEIIDIRNLLPCDARKECRVVKLPDHILNSKVTSLSRSACANIKANEIILPQFITTIGADAFYGSTIKRIVFPQSLNSLNGGALTGCKKLESITFTDGWIYIHHRWNDKYSKIERTYEDLFSYSDVTNIREIEVLGNHVSEALSLVILSYDITFPQNGINIYPKYLKPLTIDQLNFFLSQYQKAEAVEKIVMVMQEINNRKLASLPEKFRTQQSTIELL